MQEAGSEEFKQKQGRCRGQIVLWEQPVSMPQAILKTLTFFMVSAFMIGYVLSFALTGDADRHTVFRLAFTVGILTHCFAKFPHLFWFPQKSLMSLLDGVVYALITAGVFYWLWPAQVVLESLE